MPSPHSNIECELLLEGQQHGTNVPLAMLGSRLKLFQPKAQMANSRVMTCCSTAQASMPEDRAEARRNAAKDGVSGWLWSVHGDLLIALCL